MFRLIRVVAPAFLLVATPAVGTPKTRTILFVGNSFTQGSLSSVLRYHAQTVTDLNGSGYGGVPALFETFAAERRLNYAVFLETQGGKALSFHWNERRPVLDRRWDAVVLQEYSTLDPVLPGDPSNYRKYALLLADMFTQTNPDVDIELMATWSRADLTYLPGSPWSGKPITAMALDIRKAADGIKAQSMNIGGVVPVGEAWNRAIAAGLADANPYDGIAPGQIDLWAADRYHASAAGYYLEALVVFGRVTHVDPRKLGAHEQAAIDLGIAPNIAVALQRVAHKQLIAGD